MSDQVRTGTKLSAEEIKNLDPARRVVMITGTPPTAEVEGQEHIWLTACCPWCHFSGRFLSDTDHLHWVTCGNCGNNFQV